MVHLRLAVEEDEAFLQRLYISTRAEEVAGWGWTPAQCRAFLDLQFEARRQGYRAQYPGAVDRIVLRDGAPVGRVLLHHGPAVVCLVDIALLLEHRNAGIGTDLIRQVQVEAGAAGKPVCLHVLTASRAARLYQRLGFVATGDDGLRLRMEWRGGGCGEYGKYGEYGERRAA